MTRKVLRIGWMLLLCIGFMKIVFAGQMTEHGAYSITDFEWIEDANGEYSFDDISSSRFSNQFRPLPQEVISLGITKSAYWIRFRLPPNDTVPQGNGLFLQFNNPNIDKMDLFIPVADNSTVSNVRYIEKAVGVSRPSTNRDIWDNSWVLSIPQQYRQDQFLYLRLESSSALRLPVLLWQENFYISEAFRKNIGFGVFYGILLAMLLYNLFIYFVLRDKTYLFYILYIGFMLLYQFQVHGHLKLWLDMPYPMYNAFFWLCLAAAFIASIYFAFAFLQVHTEESPWDKIKAALVAMAFLQGVLGMLDYNYWANQIAHGLGLAEPVVFMSLAAVRLRQGFGPARYFLLAWGVLSAGIVTWVLAAYIPDTFSAVNYLLVATASESVLLSFALSYRFKTLRLKETAMRKHIQYYRDLSLTDELTGLYNKRYFDKKMNQEVTAAKQSDAPLAVMVIDIDHFKTYNDCYGHWKGDQVLIRLGELLLSILDHCQFAFRYGGEEFVVLLTGMNCDAALPIAERIREKLQGEPFTPIADKKVTVTASIGLAEFSSNDNAETLFQRADEAMYGAKTTGRNRVVCAEKVNNVDNSGEK